VETHVEIGRPPTQEGLAEWYLEHNINADEDGSFTELPYGPSPVEKAEIVNQVRINAERHDIRNAPFTSYTPKTMVFVCGGPTLSSHLDELKAKSLDDNYEVFTSNMTFRYLLSKGIKAKYHVIIDPTEKKKKDLEYDCDDAILLLGLQCHPAVFDAIGNRKAYKFLAASALNHTPSDVDVAQAACTNDDPNLLGIGGGSMMGTRALYLASAMGYRRIEYYGFDACIDYTNNRVRCYSYEKHRRENVLEVEAGNGRKFFSTIAFARQADEIVSLMDKLPGMDVVIHGDSFMSNQVAIYKQLNAPAKTRITPKYQKMQRKYHKEVDVYGVSGMKHAPRIFMAGAQVHRKVGKCDILDYGCGKQTLKAEIERSFAAIPGMQVIGYDPCIEGLDAEPSPAEIVVCTDVLEHVEVECVDTVMKHIHSLTKKIAILEVDLQPANKILPDGRNAHICLKDKDWWASWIKKYFVIIEQSNEGREYLVVAQPIEIFRERNKQ
tara:strand:- start:1345 stop:2826 length:1482 start_codon:yes stop_codon:yes gene_type:complete